MVRVVGLGVVFFVPAHRRSPLVLVHVSFAVPLVVVRLCIFGHLLPNGEVILLPVERSSGFLLSSFSWFVHVHRSQRCHLERDVRC